MPLPQFCCSGALSARSTSSSLYLLQDALQLDEKDFCFEFLESRVPADLHEELERVIYASEEGSAFSRAASPVAEFLRDHDLLSYPQASATIPPDQLAPFDLLIECRNSAATLPALSAATHVALVVPSKSCSLPTRPIRRSSP